MGKTYLKGKQWENYILERISHKLVSWVYFITICKQLKLYQAKKFEHFSSTDSPGKLLSLFLVPLWQNSWGRVRIEMCLCPLLGSGKWMPLRQQHLARAFDSFLYDRRQTGKKKWAHFSMVKQHQSIHEDDDFMTSIPPPRRFYCSTQL